MCSKTKNTLLVAGLLVIQCLAIGWLIWRYECVVRLGTEVRFMCQAYDPYDPLRGRYLRTTVREQCVYSGELPQDYKWRMRLAKKLYGKLAPKEDGSGLYQLVQVAEKPTDDGLWVIPEKCYWDYALSWNDRDEGENRNDFNTRREASGMVAIMSFPSQLFLNEKLAPEAEKLLVEKTRTESAVAVYRVYGGKIVLVDIEIDGQSIIDTVKERMRK